MIDIYEESGFLKENLIDKPLSKERILNADKSGYISIELKKIFLECVEAIKIKYIFKSNTKSKNTDLVFIDIEINNAVCIYDVATVIGRLIAYPLIIKFTYKGRFKIGLIKNRLNKKNEITNTIVDIKFTGWLKLKSDFGRKKEFLDKFSFKNMYNDSLDIMIDNYYNLILEFESKYVELNNAVKFIKKMELPYELEIKKDILKHCVHVKANDESKQIDIYKVSRMDKYDTSTKDKFMICRDEFYSYLQKKHSEFRCTYNDYVEYLNSLYDIIRFENSKKKRVSLDCKFYDEFVDVCICKYIYPYGCTNPQTCEYFKKRREW